MIKGIIIKLVVAFFVVGGILIITPSFNKTCAQTVDYESKTPETDPAKCTIRPDATAELCSSGQMFRYEYTSGAGNVGICHDKDVEAFACQDQYFQCKFRNWKGYCDSTLIAGAGAGCCPADWSHSVTGSYHYCCPPGYTFDSEIGRDYCFKQGTSEELRGVSTMTYTDKDGARQSLTNNGNDQMIYGQNHVEKISGNAMYRTVGSNEKIFGCFNKQYYCPYYGNIANEAKASYDFSKAANQIASGIFEGNLLSFSDSCRCAPTCTDYRTNSFQGSKVCIPPESADPNAQIFFDPNGNGVKEFREKRCTVAGVGPGNTQFQGCNTIKYDAQGNDKITALQEQRAKAVTAGDEARIKSIDQQITKIDEDYKACIACEGDPQDPNNESTYVWTGIGCIEPTGAGIVNRVFQIGFGVMGAVIIVRIFQIIALFINPESSSDAPAEARNIFLSILTFAIVVAGALIILRFIGYNILGIDLPIFTGQ